MAESPNLAITHVEAAQFSPEQPTNEAIDKLDKAICDSESVAVTTADVTLTSTQALENVYIKATGAMTAARNLIVPDNKKFYLIEHACTGGFTLTVKTAAGSGVGLVNGDKKLLYCDGTNVVGPF